jgi:SOS-response transcriptional repressor LexA
MKPQDAHDIAVIARNTDKGLNSSALTLLNAIWHGRNQAHPPSVRELMDLTGIDSTNGIAFHLNRLRKLGLIEWDVAKGRTLSPRCRFIPADELAALPLS